MAYVIPPPSIVAIPVSGGGAFPVRRIFCVGRNYADHAREMGHDPTREAPFFFTKPADAYVPSGATIPYPPATRELHHEIELVVALGAGGAGLAVESALDCVFGYAVGLDLTRRDLQADAKKQGRPWDMAKGFDLSAPCAPIIPVATGGHPTHAAIWLKVNGQTRQASSTAHMIWSVAETIAYLSGLVTLAPGDLIYTGTPEGVGPIAPGDTLLGHIDGVGDLDLIIAE